MSAIMLLALFAGSWGPQGCVAVAMPQQATRTTHEWVGVPGRPDEFALMLGGRQIGSYSQNRGLYRPYDRRTDTWGEPCDPPIAPPANKNVEPDDPPPPETTNFGIDTSKMTTDREKVTLSGREVTQADALREIARSSGTIPDDSGKPWIVYVGDPVTCARVEKDLKTDPTLSAYRDKFRLQCYPPDDPMVKDRDGKVMYSPGVWVVGADRKVMGRMPTYSTPALFAEGLRRLGPDWDPAKVPDLSKPTDPPLAVPDLTKIPVWQVGAGLGVAGVLFFVGRWLLRLAPLLLPLLARKPDAAPPVTPAPAPQPVARRPSKEALEAARQLMEGRK